MKTVYVIIFLVFTALMSDKTDGLAVMSVDIGMEWMKIAIVSPGNPMEIVLNKETKRKTPFVVSIRNDEREFGENALSLSARYPDQVYKHLLGLIGKRFDNPAVKLFEERFPYYKLVEDAERKTVLFQHDNSTVFSVEELMAMLLEKAKLFAEETARQPIKDVVLTVPAYFNQAERKAFKTAAQLANLKVLQLIGNNAAVALNYGVFRRKEFTNTPQYIMFYDVGSSSAVATIVSYQLIKMKEKGFQEENPQLTVLGVGYDRRAGGLELTLRLRDHFAKKFNEMKLTSKDVFQNGRAMEKLMKEAERVKMVLSVNNEYKAQVEGLLDDKDFRLIINRAEFQSLCEDLFKKIAKPVEKALKSADLTLDLIDQVILVGAGTRVPKVQEEILKATGKKELGKNLNTDEAAALGAAYQAAHLSQGFKVKRFNVKEAVMFPIQVSFEREREESEGVGIKHVTRVLFGPMNPYPQKKVMTFNRHIKDFSLLIQYGNLSAMDEQEKQYFGSTNILNVSVSGVAEQLSKHSGDNSEYKGVKAHFKMDDSGILQLDQFESVFEKMVAEVNEEKIEESAFSMIGNKISQLFSGISTEDKLESDDQTPTEEPPVDVPTSDNETQTDQTTSGNNQTKNGTESNETNSETKNKTEESAAAVIKSKVVSIKEPIETEMVVLDLGLISDNEYQDLKQKLKLFNDKEKAKFELEESRNSLESFILETREKLYEDEFQTATTEEEREQILNKLSETSDWLYEESEDAKVKVFKEKLSSVKSATREMYERVREHRDRPEALNALKDMLNGSEYFYKQAANLTEDEQYFTQVELETLNKLITETKEWANDKEEEQNKLELFKNPVLTVSQIVEKMQAIDREVKYLINKAKTAKSKPPKKIKEPETVKETPNNTNSTANQTESARNEEKLVDSETTPNTAGSEKTEEKTSENVEVPPPEVEKKQETDSKTEKTQEKEKIDPSETETKEHSEL
ncbi:hypothetical protein CHUAL_008965 [Chamberlinius hualienensis]